MNFLQRIGITRKPVAISEDIKLTEKQQGIVIDFMRQNIGRYRRELDQWTFARETRYDVDNPLTYQLHEMYVDAMVDTHLTAITNNRSLRIQNLDWEIVNADGTQDEYLTEMLEEEFWFTKIMEHVMESVFYGYSLIHIKDAKKKTIKELELIPREHITPEKGWIIKNPTDTDRGLPYADFKNHLLYAQMYDQYGLLEKASPMTILKRHSWGSWDEFENKFGLPISIAYVPSGNTKMQREVSQWLHEMGRSAAGVFPTGSKIELVQQNNADAFKVFFEKVAATNTELSKLVNGQTMTVEDGSSRSQSETHQKTQDEITKADIRKVKVWLNSTLKPALIANGIPIKEGQRFSIKKVSNPSEKIKIDSQLMVNGYKPTRDYIERTYGVELDEAEPTKPIDTKKKS